MPPGVPPESSLGDPPSGGHAGPRAITPDMLAAPTGDVESRIDFERGMSYAPVLTLLLILANLTLFIVELASGALDSCEAIIRAGALHRESVLHGEVWRAVSAMFLHSGFDHLLGNCLILYIVGMACEHAVGQRRTAALYFASGIGGFCVSLLVNPGPSVGASGAIFGLTGALIAFLYRHRETFYVREKRTALVLAAWAAYQIVIGFLAPWVDNFAHLGGLLAGAICVWPMKPRIKRISNLEDFTALRDR